jgi:hypothetical protein
MKWRSPQFIVDGFKLKGDLDSLYFEFEYRKSRTIKGDIILMLNYATKCSILHIDPQLLSQDS